MVCDALMCYCSYYSEVEMDAGELSDSKQQVEKHEMEPNGAEPPVISTEGVPTKMLHTRPKL